MTSRRTAVVVLAVLAVCGALGVQMILRVMYDETVYSGVSWENPETLRDMVVRQILFSVGMPALSTLFAASAFALVIIGVRAIAERWTARDQRAVRAEPSEWGADDERARLDVEVGRND